MLRRGLPLLLLSLPLVAAFGPAQAPAPAAARVVLGLDGKPDTLPDAAFVETIQKQCSKCHVPPQPQYLPRGMWRLRIQEMAQRSLMGTGVTPGEESVLWQMDTAQFVRYFEARAPVSLPLPRALAAGRRRAALRAQDAWTRRGAARSPSSRTCASSTSTATAGSRSWPATWATASSISASPCKKPGELREIARIPNPDHAEMVDLDKDGKQDLLVADLGDFMPGDHEKGSIVWLRQTAPLQFEKIVLVEKIARTADVQAADFDGDGDLDLVAAAFGWHTVGGIFVYENQTTDWKQPKFEGYPVDARPGGIHVPIADLNKDGKPDFVALISQQFEHVVAFINRGAGKGFRAETIFRAVVPVWGSSGIQLVDMDKDGDLDLLMSNGDSLDDFTVRPFHGIRWFENEGSYPWKQHDLAIMPGRPPRPGRRHGRGRRPRRGGGGLPARTPSTRPSSCSSGRADLAPLTSLGWLEQTKPGVFVPHPLEQGKLTHTTLDLGDVDGDGDVDVVTGNFVGFTFTKTDTGFKADAALDLWVNQAKP